MADVVVNPGNNKPAKNTKKNVFIVIFSVCLLLVLFFTIFSLQTYRNNKDKKSAKDAYVSKQKYLNKQSELNNKLKSATSTEEKTNIYFEQVNIALKSGNINDAEKYANLIKAAPSSSQSYNVSMAYIEEAKNNKNAAIKYWQQAINSLDNNLEEYNLIKNDYEINIKKLRE